MRVVIAEDEILLREGLVRLLTELDFDVVGSVSDARALLRDVERTRPDVAIVDIRMPPTHTDEGLRGALEIRERFPFTGVLVLSHYLESRYAMHLLEGRPERVGDLLKDRASDVAVLVDAIRRITEGERGLDPTIAARPLRRSEPGPLVAPRRPGKGGARVDGRGPFEPGPVGTAATQPADGRDPRAKHLPQAGPAGVG